MEKITFDAEDGTQVEFGVIEQTRINGFNYLLVVDMEDQEVAYILKDVSEETDEVGCYELVEDEEEEDIVFGVFETMLGDEIEFVE
ncbi:MAG: DUF1292 domain-containing protein [Lachnospiraceae bacterium]|jgi:hypothetical protein